MPTPAITGRVGADPGDDEPCTEAQCGRRSTPHRGRRRGPPHTTIAAPPHIGAPSAPTRKHLPRSVTRANENTSGAGRINGTARKTLTTAKMGRMPRNPGAADSVPQPGPDLGEQRLLTAPGHRGAEAPRCAVTTTATA